MSRVPPSNTEIESCEDKKFRAQLLKVYWAFHEAPKTMKEVDREVGVMRENICRYCRTLRLQGKLHPVVKRQCSVTKFPTVTAWTTNPDLVPPSNQLELFPND